MASLVLIKFVAIASLGYFLLLSLLAGTLDSPFTFIDAGLLWLIGKKCDLTTRVVRSLKIKLEDVQFGSQSNKGDFIQLAPE